MLQDSNMSADEDMQLRALKEQQVEAERIILATQSALEADANLLTEAEQKTVIELIAQLQNIATGNDRNAIEKAINALANGTEEFAARRMDKSVRKALTGKSLDQI